MKYEPDFGFRICEQEESGAKAAALQALSRLLRAAKSREAFGVRALQRRFSGALAVQGRTGYLENSHPEPHRKWIYVDLRGLLAPRMWIPNHLNPRKST